MNSPSIDKIGIIGVGMVGTQVKKWFERNGEQVFAYDKHKNIGSLNEVNRADVLFVCVPTPYKEKNEYDLSILEKVIDEIDNGKVVVIKSTVNPGTTDYFQQKYPKKTFLFNPEFLTELTAEQDFQNPDMQILGVPYQGYEIASKLMLVLPRSPVMRIVSPIDAEWIKKARNAFYALKVIFFNQLYDIVVKNSPADYETIRNVMVEDPRIGNSHSFIFHKNYRGFGGKCLPKDFYSLIEFAERIGVQPELFRLVKSINEKLLNDQRIKDWN